MDHNLCVSVSALKSVVKPALDLIPGIEHKIQSLLNPVGPAVSLVSQPNLTVMDWSFFHGRIHPESAMGTLSLPQHDLGEQKILLCSHHEWKDSLLSQELPRD